jgi:hypothetical protein
VCSEGFIQHSLEATVDGGWDVGEAVERDIWQYTVIFVTGKSKRSSLNDFEIDDVCNQRRPQLQTYATCMQISLCHRLVP